MVGAEKTLRRTPPRRAKRKTLDAESLAFAQRLRSVRLALGLSEEEAARAAGRTVKTWRKYETAGFRGITTGALLRFVKAYRLNVDWLFAGDGTGTPGLDAPPRSRWANAADLDRGELAEFVRHAPDGMLPVVVEGGWLIYLNERYRADFERLNRIRVLPRVVA